MGHTGLQLNKEQSEHLIKNVRIVKDYVVETVFTNGVVKQLDLSPIFSFNEQLNKLQDYSLFKKLYCSKNDFAVHWTDEIDLGCEYFWDNGKTIETIFDNLLSMPEATYYWGLSESTLRKALERGKLKEGIDAKKFAGQWVLIKGAVEREYGLSIPDQIKMHENSLLEFDDPNCESMVYFKSHPEIFGNPEEAKRQIKNEIEALKKKLK